MIRTVFTVLTCMLSFIFLHGGAMADRFSMRYPPRCGDEWEFYDVDCQARVLKIDYRSGSVQVLGKLPLDAMEMALPRDGWMLPGAEEKKRELLLLDSRGALYLFDTESSEFRKCPVQVYIRADYRIEPVLEDIVLISYVDTDTDQCMRVVFDPQKNAVVSTPSFGLFRGMRYRLSPSNPKHLYCKSIEGTEQVIEEVSLETGKPVRTLHILDVIPHNEDTENAFIIEIEENFVVLATRDDYITKCSYCVADIHTGQLLGISDVLPFFYGEWFFDRSSYTETKVVCMKEHVLDDIPQPTGKLLHFAVKDGKLELTDETCFDPETQILLRNENGVLETVQRREFGYRSIFALTRWVFGEYSPATMKETLTEESLKTFNTLADEYNEKHPRYWKGQQREN
ncbi:MAG TPA: hypothetical protein PLO37_15530 [Candidatus Hydrogenedentes bacterium]|nr:hypothetical protein [Candidatus Hydrogenedentota bacterium]HPG68257.1 hypothetical protein [Candidatus Hydrogenedentota bacterium]